MYQTLDDDKDGSGFTVKIKELSGKLHDFSLANDNNVGDLKKVIETKLGHQQARQRLIFRGRELRNDSSALSEEFKGLDTANVVVHLVVRPENASGTPLPDQKVTQVNAQPYRQSRPMQTVRCPFCRTMVQFPMGSQMIRCSSCGGISRIQVAQEHQRTCPASGCNVRLAYRSNMEYVRCPKCVSTIDTARW
eukprot:CAMPEP_0197523924 /NCGR_PEP_ID=MMETSP1318-20131121/8743_1 /TAXON_ID=552666 /ORGANISM="Partenskyella glossopodia, Strain RCC365" /LENGTH=191 /DNA_ID=CAMNT_0043076755 /DNA_START=49 /DNA_END=621 /DNA_ORIENTATION=+